MSTGTPTFFLDVSNRWYRERSVALAFALSVLVHAAAVALLPGLRLQRPESPAPLVVELVAAPQPESAAVEQTPPQPEPVRKIVPLQRERSVARAVPAPSHIEPLPVPAVEPRRDVTPEPAPPPPVQEVRPEPPPPAQARPEPQIAPPPVAPQAERDPTPRAEPQPLARAETPAPVIRQGPSLPDPGALKAYGETLVRAFDKKKSYPRLARQRNWQGTTQLKLHIGTDGRLQEVAVSRSSGFEMLDSAAVHMVQDSLPLPELPDVLRGRDLTLTVPIVFKLESL